MRIIHDDPPMRDEIAAGFYPRFEGQWHRAEVLGRIAMSAFAAVCGLSRVSYVDTRNPAQSYEETKQDRVGEPTRSCLGLLGQGPFSERRGQRRPLIAIRYEPILRHGAPMSVAALLGDDRSVVGAMSALVTVGLMHVGVSWLRARFVWLERILDGTPIVVFRKGRWNEAAMRNLRMQQADIRTAARQQGLDDLAAVDVAVVERDGTLSVLEKD